VADSFNPRARAGRDFSFYKGFQFLVVSIHAPARGATCLAGHQIRVGQVSIHAPARGATSFINLLSQFQKFQSTRPRGARLYILYAQHEKHVSIHAPARGATKRDHGNAYHEWFQSTRPRGARPEKIMASAVTADVSIHAPARGATVQRL